MARTSIIFASLSTAAVLAGLGAAQDSAQNSTKSQLTARELYYAAAAPSQPAAPKPQAPSPAPKSAQAKNTSTPSRPAEVAVNTPPKPSQPPAPSTPAQTDSTPATAPRPQQGSDLPGGGRIVNASTATAPASGPALGLKYSILKEDAAGEYVEVAPDTVFHAGDHIRFNVESNSPGYLYIVLLGSSGTWQPMFPASDVDNGSNRIEAFHSYTMPPRRRMTFDQRTGEEKFFIVLSRDPEPDLERMIYTLQEDGSTTRPAYQPAGQPAPPPNPPLYKPDNTGSHQKLMASASIDNNTIGHLRQAYTRDLIVETITDQTAGDRKEKAVYVVNPSGSKDSRLATDLTLVHK
jgi:hypothetical protein